jgi:predicted Zn-dependent protease with MMP-like domain
MTETQDALRRFGPPPTAGEIEELARRILATLPPALLAHCEGLAIRVEDFADDRTLEEMGIESPFDLAGLYRGSPLPAKGAGATQQHLDTVLLFRRAMLDWWAEDGMPFEDLVRHLLIHEIGHHFGFSDADMERIEQASERES